LAPNGGRDPSRGQPITLAVFHDATVRDERGKPFVEGCVAHAALGPEVGEGQRGRSIREGRGDTLIEGAWRRLRRDLLLHDLDGQRLACLRTFDLPGFLRGSRAVRNCQPEV